MARKAKIKNYTSRGEYKKLLRFDRFEQKKKHKKNYLKGGLA